MINQYKGVLRKGFISYHHPTQAELAFNEFIKPKIEQAVLQGQDCVASTFKFCIEDIKHKNSEFIKFLKGLKFAHELGYTIHYSEITGSHSTKKTETHMFSVYIKWDEFPNHNADKSFFEFGVKSFMYGEDVVRYPTKDICNVVIDMIWDKCGPYVLKNEDEQKHKDNFVKLQFFG